MLLKCWNVEYLTGCRRVHQPEWGLGGKIRAPKSQLGWEYTKYFINLDGSEEKKILAIFPWSGKIPSRVSEWRRVIPQGGKDKREKREGGKEGKTTGVKGGTIFYSQSQPWIKILDFPEKGFSAFLGANGDGTCAQKLLMWWFRWVGGGGWLY